MAHRFNEPSTGRLRRSQISVDALGIWVDDPTPESEHASHQSETPSDEEEETYPQQEMEQAPFPYDERGPQPWDFPSRPPLRLSQARELTKLRFPNDVPVQALERMKNREGDQWYVNYPTRLFHLRPLSNLKIPKDLNWEDAFLWQKVSSSQCKAAWIQGFPCPALDMPLPYFPKALLTQGMQMGELPVSKEEALMFAAAVFSSTARPSREAEQDFDVEWKDIRSKARNIVRQLEKRGSRRATVLAIKVREHREAVKEYDSFFRFRDSTRKPTGLGFRGSRDMFFLDNDYITDFLNRASQKDALSVRMRSEVKLIPFLNSLDAAKVTTLLVSAQAFRDTKKRTYLCYAVAKTFSNLEELHLISVGTVGSGTAALWNITPELWFRTGSIRRLAEDEIELNGGSSYLQHPLREEFPTRFDLSNMSSALINATGASADGRGRSLAGEPARTPLVAYGIKAGLIHDPEPGTNQQPPADQDPPFIAAVQHMLTAAFRVIVRRREAAAKATRAEAAANLEGRWTLLPQPVASGLARGVWSVDRRYMPSEVRPEDYRWWAQDHIARERRKHAHAKPESVSAHSVPTVDIEPWNGEYPRVRASVLIYDQDAYDKNVHNGWTGFGPGVDLSYFQ